MSVNDNVQLKKAENAWKPGLKREVQAEDTEAQKTQARTKKTHPNTKEMQITELH